MRMTVDTRLNLPFSKTALNIFFREDRENKNRDDKLLNCVVDFCEKENISQKGKRLNRIQISAEENSTLGVFLLYP